MLGVQNKSTAMIFGDTGAGSTPEPKSAKVRLDKRHHHAVCVCGSEVYGINGPHSAAGKTMARAPMVAAARRKLSSSGCSSMLTVIAAGSANRLCRCSMLLSPQSADVLLPRINVVAKCCKIPRAICAAKPSRWVVFRAALCLYRWRISVTQSALWLSSLAESAHHQHYCWPPSPATHLDGTTGGRRNNVSERARSSRLNNCPALGGSKVLLKGIEARVVLFQQLPIKAVCGPTNPASACPTAANDPRGKRHNAPQGYPTAHHPGHGHAVPTQFGHLA